MTDARWMASALALARRAQGQTAPNPAVGAILVKHGIVLGRAVTAQGGRPHAETQALSQAVARGYDCEGATLYVTLEPCAHHGKTPPCVDAVIAARVARVVCPMADPDPRVAGKGFARLRDAGIGVDIGLMATEARSVNAGFLSRIERGRPWVTLKLATTLDGQIATRTGESRWITGPASRRYVHLMRAQADAIMVGAGTARVDDPMLDVRELGMSARSPLRIVFDGALSLPLTSRLVRSADTIPVLLLHRASADPDRRAALQELGIRTAIIPDTSGTLDLEPALQLLAQEHGITRLMCEGGGRLAASLLSAGLVDDLVVFQAGKIIGEDGLSSVRGFGLEALVEAPRFSLTKVQGLGSDVVSHWTAPTS